MNGYNYFNKETDDPKEWKETLKAKGEYLTNLDALDSYMDDSYARYRDLESWGAIEDRHVLRDKIINSIINTLERVMITDLILQDGKIAGAVGIPFDREEFIVTGVVENAPVHTDFQYDFFIPISFVARTDDADNWGDHWLYTYVLLQPNAGRFETGECLNQFQDSPNDVGLFLLLVKEV